MNDNRRWKEEILTSSRKKSFWGEVLIVAAFASCAVISAYPGARLAFDVPFPGIVLFAALLVAAFALSWDSMTVHAPFLVFLPAFRLAFYLIPAFSLSVDSELILEQIAMTVVGMGVFLYFYNVQDGAVTFRRTLTVFAFITSLQLLVCIVGLGSGYDKNLLVAGIGGSNYAASFLLIAVVFLLFRAVTTAERIVLIFSLSMLILTLSFGAFLGLFAAVLVWFVGRYRQNKRVYSALLVLLVVLILILAVNIGRIGILSSLLKEIRERIEMAARGDFEGVTSSRFSLYRYSLTTISKHPIFGAIVNSNDAYTSVEYTEHQFERTHNVLLESLLLYGIVGTVINFAIFSSVIRQGREAIRRRPGRRIFFLVLFIALLHGLLEPNFFTLNFELFIWAVLGVYLSPSEQESDYVFNREEIEPTSSDDPDGEDAGL